MPPGGIKAMRASALPMRNLAISVGALGFKELPLRAKSAKKLEPSDDSNFNTLGFCSNVLRHLHSLSGEKGNTLVSQKRMQKYSIFFTYANILQKKCDFLCDLVHLCKANVANAGQKIYQTSLKPR